MSTQATPGVSETWRCSGTAAAPSWREDEAARPLQRCLWCTVRYLPMATASGGWAAGNARQVHPREGHGEILAHGRKDSERAQLAEGTAANSVWGVARTGRCREWDIAGAPPQPRRGGRPRGQRRRPVGMAVRRHCGGGWAAPRGGVAPLADQLLRWRGQSPQGAGNPLVD